MAPPNTNSHGHDTPYLNALLNAIPDGAIPPELKSASTSKSVQALPKFIDAALRLASGGSSRPNDDALLRDSWPQIQASLQDTLHALGSPPAHAKRKHSPSPSAQTAPTNNKKSKLEDEDDGIEDPPHLTLHAVSATAPVRHKVDITLHARSLRLAHATSGASVARSAREALTRAFLLPTRARSSGAPQWTALLLAGDTPTPTPTASRKNNGAGPGAKGKEKGIARFELACSVPEAGAVPRLTIHSAPSSSLAHKHARSHSVHPAPSAPLPTLFPLALRPNLSPHHSQTRTNRARHASRGYHRLPWRARDVTLVPRWCLRRQRVGRDPVRYAPGRVLGSYRSRPGRRGRPCIQRDGTHVYCHPHSAPRPTRYINRGQRRRRGGRRDGVSDDRWEGEGGDRGVGAEA
jgi:hypothetical protein